MSRLIVCPFSILKKKVSINWTFWYYSTWSQPSKCDVQDALFDRKECLFKGLHESLNHQIIPFITLDTFHLIETDPLPFALCFLQSRLWLEVRPIKLDKCSLAENESQMLMSLTAPITSQFLGTHLQVPLSLSATSQACSLGTICTKLVHQTSNRIKSQRSGWFWSILVGQQGEFLALICSTKSEATKLQHKIWSLIVNTYMQEGKMQRPFTYPYKKESLNDGLSIF